MAAREQQSGGHVCVSRRRYGPPAVLGHVVRRHLPRLRRALHVQVVGALLQDLQRGSDAAMQRCSGSDAAAAAASERASAHTSVVRRLCVIPHTYKHNPVRPLEPVEA